MKVSKITIGRLYNLGNYEHVRYELTVEVPEGESAAQAVHGLANILRGLKPDRTAKSPDDLKRSERALERMEAMSDADFQAHYLYSREFTPEKRKQITDDARQQLAEEKAKAEGAKARKQIARSLFDDVGGAAAWKDAKEDWQDNYED